MHYVALHFEKEKADFSLFCANFCQIKVCNNTSCITGKIRHRDENRRKTLLTLFFLPTAIYSTVYVTRKKLFSLMLAKFLQKQDFSVLGMFKS